VELATARKVPAVRTGACAGKAVVVAFAAFSFVAGVVAFIVKLAVVVGIVWVVSRLVLRRASR